VESEQARVGFVSFAIPLYSTTGPVMAALSVIAPLYRAEVAKYVSLLQTMSRRFPLSIGSTSDA
jgi:hypothetical protein